MSDERVLSGYSAVRALRPDGSVRSYRATGADGADVCVKVVDVDAELAKGALRSLEIARQLHGPDLASVCEQGLTDSGYYVVREWVDGTDLGIRPVPDLRTPTDAASAVAKGLAGMAALHGAGVVCGNVRPTNFVVAADGSTKLVDYLVSTSPPSRGPEPADTAYYTSPEEIAGAQPSVGSDLYRAGLVLYEVLAGRRPFDGPDAAAVIAGHERTVPMAPSALNPVSPKKLDAVVLKALSKDPAARYESADAMGKAIEHAIAPSKRIWLWVAVAVVAAIVLFGAYSTQTQQGQLWVLGLRSMVSVPNVIGQTQSQAQVTLEAAGMRLGQVSEEPTLAVAPGTVVGQSPGGGTTAKKDSAVDVSIASIPTVKVPDVVGQTESEAITTLAEEGLRPGPVTYVYDSKTPAGKVTAQQPSASEEASVGSAVNLTVSKGAQQGQVPNVIGLSQDDANAVITAAGFKVTTVKATSSSVPAGDVVAQSPGAGVVTAAGSTVTITVSTGAPAAPTAPTNPAPPSGTASTPATPETPTKPSEPAAPTVSVPDVVGQSVKDAVTALKDAKLKVSFEFAPSESSFLKVTKQDPASGTTVDPGSTVIITIGLPSISLPDEKPTQPMPLPAPEPLPSPTATQQPAPSTPTTP